MAIKIRSAWWISLVLAAGLLALFAGERAFGHLESARSVLSGLGALLVLGSTALRASIWSASRGRQRAVEMIMLLCHVGVLVALSLYILSTPAGTEMLGIADDEALHRFRTAATVAWAIVLAVSLVPLLLIEVSLGTLERAALRPQEDMDEASVDLFRVREMASAGLTIALAAAFLMVTCNVADQRNVRKDVSYFKTSSPGSATVKMAASMTEPLTVLLFFPEVSEVAEEVEGYFESLARMGGNLRVERRDRLVDSELAEEHRVAKDGTIVLVRGTKPAADESDPAESAAAGTYKAEKLTVNPELQEGRIRSTELREFDSKVQKALMQVIRDQKIAYLSTGHGELNDPESAGPMAMANPLAKSTVIREVLRYLNYEVKDWDGFGKPVPDDASVLLILAPRRAFLAEDLREVDDFLARGGAALIALDPEGAFSLGALEARLGLRFNPAPVADDKEFMVRTRTLSDRYLLLTSQFSSHAAITTVSRGGARSGMLFIKAGSLDEVPQADSALKRTFVIRSMASSFRDQNGNFQYDPELEARGRFNLAAAIEDAPPTANPVDGDQAAPPPTAGMRAFVVADGEIFSDAILSQIPIVQALVVDAIKWLGGEEEFAGDTNDEKDVRIEHSRSQDALWFYSTVLGAPILVLLFGYGFIALRRRRQRTRRTS